MTAVVEAKDALYSVGGDLTKLSKEQMISLEGAMNLPRVASFVTKEKETVVLLGLCKSTMMVCGYIAYMVWGFKELEEKRSYFKVKLSLRPNGDLAFVAGGLKCNLKYFYYYKY